MRGSAVLLDHDRYCDEIVSQAELIARLLDGADTTMPVLTCPEWTLGDLEAHVTRQLRVLQDAVRTAEARTALRRAGGSGSTTTGGLAVAPAAGTGPARLDLAQTAADAAAALRRAGPRLRTRVSGIDGTTRSWARRAAHDLLIHRADAALTLGGPFAVSPDEGADALDEILELLGGPPVPRTSAAPQILLRATDTDLTWSITPDGEAFTWRRGFTDPATATRTDSPTGTGASAAGATLAGPLTALLLVIYRRLDPRSTTSRHDADLVAPWIATLAFT